MKKNGAFILLASALLFAGCLSAPDSPAALIGKNQEMMIETAQSGGEDSSRLSSLEVPEHFSGEWSGVDGCVIVHADAALILPDANSIPTASVERHPFSQSDADRMLGAFLKGSTLYQEQRAVTRQMAQEQLEHYRAIERGEIPWEHDGTAEDDLPGLIAYYEELVRTAPDENEIGPTPASTAFQTNDSWNDESIEGYAEVDGRLIHVRIFNASNGEDRARFYMDGYGDLNQCHCYYIDELPENMRIEAGMTEDAALAMGNAVMEKVGNGSFACDQIRAVAYYDEQAEWPGIMDTGYEMEFVRTINGCPIAHCPQYEFAADGSSWMIPAFTGTSIPEDEDSFDTWAYERITIHVNKDGIVYFSWLDPYGEMEMQVADTQLMSFSDIEDIFAKMILVKNSDLKAINEKNGFALKRDIEIDNVRLSLMRIRNKNNYNEGLIIPVWDFWGTERLDPEDEAYRDVVFNGGHYSVMLTINAIDGSIIDRDFGY